MHHEEWIQRSSDTPVRLFITEACYDGQFSDKLNEHLDTAHGSCALRDPRLAPIVADRLHHFDGQRYDLGSDVIMPNHVHALFTLRDTLQSWKAVSSRLIHPTGLSALNPFWQPDDFDRLIRSPEHFSTVKAYIRENPPPWNEITEACNPATSPTSSTSPSMPHKAPAPCVIHALPGSQSFRYGAV